MSPSMESGAAASPRIAVLVTGASTGFGRRITERLAAEGHFVYAGARKDCDLHALSSIRNVEALRLDVTSTQDIASAVDTIAKAGRGLYGLVNNAGVGALGPIVDCAESEFDLVMKVNVYGPYRVTKAVVPFIVAAKGRIVTIGSVSGILSDANVGAYNMSKHAIEAFADTLAMEMRSLGVESSVIEPGAFRSDLINNVNQRAGFDSPLFDLSNCREPDDVVAAAELALFEPKPRRRYLVVATEYEAQRTIQKQFEKLIQLNEGHCYTFGREALTKMLDQELAKSRPRAASPYVPGAFVTHA